MADDQGEKTEEPTQHRIDESRKKGDVASSKELNNVLVLTGSLTVLIFSTLFMFEILSNYITWLYELDFEAVYTKELSKKVFERTILDVAKCIAPVFLASISIGILSQMMQIGLLYSPEVIELKFDRLNPISGFKRIFSAKSVAEVVKGVFKFAIVLAITYFVLKKNLLSFIGFLHTEAPEAFEVGKIMAFNLAFAILLGLMVVAIGDYFWEKYSYKKKLMMTRQELKQENKEQNGNPEIKQKIRSIQRQMASKRMMAEIPNADVIITNPTHISIVIKYDSVNMIAPQVIGKGSEHLALKIREIAKLHNIPIVENVPLARALYKTVKEGEGVPRNLYKAVAEVLAFVYKLKKKRKALA